MAKFRDTNPDIGKADSSERFPSIDAMRGMLLLLLVANGFGLLKEQMLNQAQWGWITSQFAHRPWQGCSLWDLLQPGMLFVVGLAMPFSYANRQAKGQSWPTQFLHALLRAGLLIALGVYLDSYQKGQLVFELRGDLQQIGLSYLLAFFVLPFGMPVHGVTIGFLLIGHTAAYVIYSIAGGHELWSQTQNLGVTIDQMLRLPVHRENYVTFNVIPATAIVITGILVAGLIRSGLTAGVKVIIMAGVSFFIILLAWLPAGAGGWVDFSWTPLIPMIKRLGTFTFVLTSVGWMLLLFAYFYTLMEGFSLNLLALPITIVGRNALFVFVANFLFHGWADRSARLLLPDSPALVFRLQPLLIELIVVFIFWLLCWWLYHRKIFFKV